MDCNDIFYIGAPVYRGLEVHAFPEMAFIAAFHEGPANTHHTLYSTTCPACQLTIQEERTTNCFPGRCNELFSLKDPAHNS